VRIPKRIKIGPYDYSVQRKETVLSDDRSELWGQYNPTAQVITLTNNMTPQREATAFLHEVFHAIDELVGSELTEKQIEVFAPALLSFLRDNKMLKEGLE
jgi:hypothetical protein